MYTSSKNRIFTRNVSWLSLAGTIFLFGGCTQIYDDTAGWGANFYEDAKNWVEHLDDPREAENQMAQAAVSGQMAQSGTPDVVFKPAEGAEAGITAATSGEFADTPPAMASSTQPTTKPTLAARDTQSVAEALRPAGNATSAKMPQSQMVPAPPPAPEVKAPVKAETLSKAEAPAKADVTAPAGKETKMAAKTEGKTDKTGAGKSTEMLTIHLSSLRSVASAKREWDQLQKAYPRLLGSLAMTVERADLGERGIFYRVLAGPLPNLSAASGICAQLKTKKQYCRLMPPKPRAPNSKKTV